MAEENKVEKPASAETPAVPATPEASAAAKPAEAPKVMKAERPTTCARCSKSIKGTRHYYRNGKFYCGKRCWKTTLKKDAPEAAKEQSA